MKLQHKEYHFFKLSILFSLLFAFVLGIFILIYGKNESFLVINNRYSAEADYFFNYVTFLGDGLLWIPLFLYTIFYKRDFIIAVLVALIISTIITHLFKRVIFMDEPRPLRLLEDVARAVPMMKGRDNYINSFPSGHTSTAFTFALLLAYLVKRKFAIIVFPLLAFLVGYSRVYLAQHFVTDVAAGIIVGITSSYIALVVYEYFRKKKRDIKAESSNTGSNT